MIWALLLSLFLSPLLLPSWSGAAEKTTVYTDSDLNQYRNPADNRPSATPERKKSASHRKSASDTKEKEYWCREGTKRTLVTEKARKRVSTAETSVAKKQDEVDRHPSQRSAVKRLNAAKKTLAKEQKTLSKEEAALSAFETRAQRKGIPPGWLRCNSEY